MDMTNLDLINKAIDILILNGISAIDLHYIREHKDELASDDVAEEDRHLHANIGLDENNEIKYIQMYSNTKQEYWNLRALWVAPAHRRQNIASALLADLRRRSRNSRGVIAFIPFNETRFNLAKALLRNGFKHRRYIASISASEYNSIW